MGSNSDLMIKKALTETITEEVFWGLGFFILRFGQGHNLNPIVQIETFIKASRENFKLMEKNKEFFTPRDWVES